MFVRGHISRKRADEFRHGMLIFSLAEGRISGKVHGKMEKRGLRRKLGGNDEYTWLNLYRLPVEVLKANEYHGARTTRNKMTNPEPSFLYALFPVGYERLHEVSYQGLEKRL